MAYQQLASEFTPQAKSYSALIYMYSLLENDESSVPLEPIVVFTAFSIEAYLNALGARVVPFWDEIERSSWRSKICILHTVAGKDADWGADRNLDGTGTDVITVSVWIPQMESYYSLSQRFGRHSDQAIFFIGDPELFKHEADAAHPVDVWDKLALQRGISSHPKADNWSTWCLQCPPNSPDSALV